MDDAYKDIWEKELQLLRSFYHSNASFDSRKALERFYKPNTTRSVGNKIMTKQEVREALYAALQASRGGTE